MANAEIKLFSIFGFLLLTACTGKVEGVVSKQQQVKTISEQVAIQIVSNSTTSQLSCAPANSVVIQVSIPADMSVYCRDNSTLLDSLTLGQTCPQGPTISKFKVDSSPLDCHTLKVCGQGPSSSQVVAKRFDGTPIVQLTFSGLPWACALSFDYSSDPTFSSGSYQTIATSVTPPICPYCPRTDSITCANCPPLSSSETLVDGQVVPTSCNGGPCASCTTKSGQTVSHASSATFYSLQIGKCGQPCNQLSQVQVCNNGTFVGDSNFQFNQCQDVVCTCQYPGSTQTYSGSGTVTFYSGSTSACGTQCSDSSQSVVAQCQSGIWVDQNLNPIDLTSFSVTTCANGPATCNSTSSSVSTVAAWLRKPASLIRSTATGASCTVNGVTTSNGNVYTFYSQPSGTCSTPCSALALDRQCDNGAFGGNAAFSFPTCGNVSCGCTLNGQSYDSSTTGITIYQNSTPSCGHLCSDADQSLTIYCNQGGWYDSKNNPISPQTLSSYPASLCQSPECDCSRAGRAIIPGDGKAHPVYSADSSTMLCPKSCSAVTGSVTCASGKLSGDTTYGFDSCTSPICQCAVNLATGSLLVNAGQQIQLSKVAQSTASDPTACTDAGNLVNLTCQQGGALVVTSNPTQTWDPTVFQYLAANCKTQDFSCPLNATNLANGGAITLYQNAQPGCGQTCQSLSVYCNAGTPTSSASSTTPIPASTIANYPATSCQPLDCSCPANGYLIPYNTSKAFYSMSSGGCDPAACAAAKGTLNCGQNKTVTVTGGGDPAKFLYDTCSTQPCSCPLPNGGSLQDGASTNVYTINATTCDNPNACNAPANTMKISCSNGTLTSYPSNFQYFSCTIPVCTCNANGQQVPIGQTDYFYNTQVATTSCQASSQVFTCQAGGQFSPANVSQYPYTNCKSPVDAGDLGGTGGGTGNGDGPGSAILKRNGLGDGGGGGGGGPSLGCLDMTRCYGESYYFNNSAVTNVFYTTEATHAYKACLLPWGGGEIEFFGTTMAFNTTCVVSPDLCSKHRISRTCHYPDWTGDPSYNYPNCVEKSSCP